MLDHDSRDAAAALSDLPRRRRRAEAAHLARLGGGAALGKDAHRPRVAALHPEREPPVERGPLRVTDEPRRESALRQLRRNCNRSYLMRT